MREFYLTPNSDVCTVCSEFMTCVDEQCERVAWSDDGPKWWRCLGTESGDWYNPLRGIPRLCRGRAGAGRCHQLCETNPIFGEAQGALSRVMGVSYEVVGRRAEARDEPNFGGRTAEDGQRETEDRGRQRTDNGGRLHAIRAVDGAKQSQFAAFWGWKWGWGEKTKPISGRLEAGGRRPEGARQTTEDRRRGQFGGLGSVAVSNLKFEISDSGPADLGGGGLLWGGGLGRLRRPSWTKNRGIVTVRRIQDGT